MYVFVGGCGSLGVGFEVLKAHPISRLSLTLVDQDISSQLVFERHALLPAAIMLPTADGGGL